MRLRSLEDLQLSLGSFVHYMCLSNKQPEAVEATNLNNLQLLYFRSSSSARYPESMASDYYDRNQF